MTLKYYHAEPLANSLKSMLPLFEKGLAFESVYVNLHKFEQHQPWFVAINPEGQVPVLDHDGAIITQTTVINEYLEDAFPDLPPLRPNTPVGNARMRYLEQVRRRACDELRLDPRLAPDGRDHRPQHRERRVRGIAREYPAPRAAREMADGPLGLQRGRSRQCDPQDRGRGRQGRGAAGRDRMAGRRHLHAWPTSISIRIAG